MCRLCLSEITNETSTVDLRQEKENEVMQKLTLFSINPNDIETALNWPSLVCGLCVGLVDQLFDYHQLVVDNQRKLPELFGVAKSVPDDPDEIETIIEECPEEVILEAADDDPVEEVPQIDEEEDPPEPDEEIIEESPPARTTRSKATTAVTGTRNNRNNEMDSTIQSFLLLKCDQCPNTEFESFLDLTAHYRIDHDMEGYTDCCGQRFTRRYKLYNHVVSHINPLGHMCDECPKKFATRYGLDMHKESHMPEEEKHFQCNICSKRFFRENKLKFHMASKHVPAEKRPFKCPECGKGFVNNSLVVDHCRKIHENLRPFICEICANSFKTKQILIDHIQTHTERPKVKCDECGKFYRNELQVKRHKKRTHASVDQVFECKECGVQAKNSYALAAHINLNHKTDPQKHQCEVCSKGFKRLKTLKEHMASHTGEKLYKCSFCDQQFNSSANKYKHQKNRHPEEYEAMKQARDQKMFTE